MGKTLKLTDEQIAQYEAAGLTWWYRATYLGKVGPIHPEKPLPGYYRRRAGVHAPWEPAAIWLDASGELRASCGFKDSKTSLELRELIGVWPFWSKERVPYEAYEAAVAAGRWPMEVAAFGSNVPAEGVPEDAKAPVPTEADPIDVHKAAIEAKRAEVEAWRNGLPKGISSQEDGDRASVYRDELNALVRVADAVRMAGNVEPQKLIDANNAAWMTFTKPGKQMADRLRDEAKAYAVRVTRERDEELRRQVQANKSAPVADIKAPEPVVFQGARSRVTPVKVAFALEVSDHKKALKFVEERPEIKRAVIDLVNALFNQGVTDIPGTKVVKVAA